MIDRCVRAETEHPFRASRPRGGRENRSPAILANWIVIEPTPPAPPIIRSVCPRPPFSKLMPNRSKRDSHAVMVVKVRRRLPRTKAS